MPSPFPGMNPYLEQEDAWHDFHQRFAAVAAEILTEQVAPRYIVRIDQNTYIHELPAEQRRLFGRPDVGLVSTGGPDPGPGAIAAAPLVVWLPAVDVERHSFVTIRDRTNREVVTIIELLSPSNKAPGSDREQYLGKRAQGLRSHAHWVEIDLLRGGPRMPHVEAPGADYCVFVSRAERRPECGVYPIRLRERLPAIPIPLRGGDLPARLDLQQVLHRVYDAARYGDYIYAGAPEPPLPPEDAEWAQQFVPPGNPAP